jgi:hypothetical protein
MNNNLNELVTLTNRINTNNISDKKLEKLEEEDPKKIISNIKKILEKMSTCKVLSIQEIKDLYQKPKFDIMCIRRGFKQHKGECWNDSIMMFFAFQDGINEIVQRKLFFLEPEEIIELALINTKKFYPKMYEEKNSEILLKKNINNYLLAFKNKFIDYHTIYINKGQRNHERSKKISISAAVTGLESVNLCSNNSDNHFANSIDQDILIHILSFFLLDYELHTDIIQIENILSIPNLSEYIGFILHWRNDENKNIGHATLIYLCNNFWIHYDNTNPNLLILNPDNTPLTVSSIKEQVNKKMDNNLKVTKITCIKKYNEITDKVKKMNAFFSFEWNKRITSNIDYYRNNGVNI